ncbi:MAG: DUF192 domain-containing protein [Planctomycetota bacterium]
MTFAKEPRGAPTLRAAALAALAVAAGPFGCGPKAAGPSLSGDRVELEVKGRKLAVEVACDPFSRQAGLMYRERLGESEGMLFIFPRPDRHGFWMANTYVPLSIAFLDDRGKILEVRDMRPKDTSHTVPRVVVRYALEVKQGWFRRNGIEEGDAFERFPETVGRFRAR